MPLTDIHPVAIETRNLEAANELYPGVPKATGGAEAPAGGNTSAPAKFLSGRSRPKQPEWRPRSHALCRPCRPSPDS